MNEYPRLHHDEKKCTKITLEQIELIKESYKKHKNYRLVGRIFHVTHVTVMMYVNEAYRKKLVADAVKRQKKRMLNPEYKKKYLALKRNRHRERKTEDPLYAKYNRLKNCGVIHKKK